VKAEKQLGTAFRSFTVTLADTVSWAQTTGTKKEQSQCAGFVSVEARDGLSMQAWTSQGASRRPLGQER
jgi:hypothetical protein